MFPTDFVRRIVLAVAPVAALGLAGCAEMPPPRPAAPTASIVASPARLVIANNSNETVRAVYLSPSSHTLWGKDLLGSAWLPRGASATWKDIAPGQWDLLIVDQSGHRKLWRGYFFAPGGAYSVVLDSGGWM